jgi:Matrixin
VSLPGAAAVEGGAVLGFPHPKAGVGEADHPLGTPLPAPAGGGPYGFTALQADGTTPVSYDPCRPIHYVVRPDNAPAGGDELIADAVARISSVTGLRLVYDGTTEEQPARKREPYQPDRYGKRWAPVLISRDTTAEDPDLAADVAGEAGSQPIAFPGEPTVYVTGAVALDAAQFGQILGRPGGAAEARAVVLHELGHLVGLAHVADPSELMYPMTSPGVVDYAAGDLAGLSRLGAGACVPAV